MKWQIRAKNVKGNPKQENKILENSTKNYGFNIKRVVLGAINIYSYYYMILTTTREGRV